MRITERSMRKAIMKLFSFINTCDVAYFDLALISLHNKSIGILKSEKLYRECTCFHVFCSYRDITARIDTCGTWEHRVKQSEFFGAFVHFPRKINREMYEYQGKKSRNSTAFTRGAQPSGKYAIRV